MVGTCAGSNCRSLVRRQVPIQSELRALDFPLYTRFNPVYAREESRVPRVPDCNHPFAGEGARATTSHFAFIDATTPPVYNSGAKFLLAKRMENVT